MFAPKQYIQAKFKGLCSILIVSEDYDQLIYLPTLLRYKSKYPEQGIWNYY